MGRTETDEQCYERTVQRQVNKATELEANRIRRIGFWRGLGTLEYPHAQLYLRDVGALVIPSVGGGAFLHLGGSRNPKYPIPVVSTKRTRLKKKQKSESESESDFPLLPRVTGRTESVLTVPFGPPGQ